jgi:hypothetical protein
MPLGATRERLRASAERFFAFSGESAVASLMVAAISMRRPSSS